MSLKKKTLSSIFWTSLQQFGTKIISFVVSIILARLLLPSDYGLIAMLTVFMGIGRVLINSGMNSSLIRTENPDQEDYSTVFIFNLIGSIIIYLIFYLIAPLVAKFYNQNILTSICRVYGVVFVINAFAVVQMTKLTKEMDFRTQLIVSLPSLVLSGVSGISLAYWGFGVWSLVWSAIIQSFLAAVQFWYWSDWRPSLVFNKEKFKYHFNFGMKLTISGILDNIFKNAYIIIIAKFFPAAQVGLYYKAESLKQLPATNIGAILNKVTFPLFSKIKNEDKRLREAYRKIMKVVIFLIAPVLIFMAVLGEPLFRFLFTEKWLGAVPYFQIICITGILYPIHAYNLNILIVKGRSDLFMKLEIVKKIVVVFIIAITFQWGIYGLLWGSVIISVICLFINSYYTGKFIDYSFSEQVRDLVPSIFFALVAGGGVILFDNYMVNIFYSGDFLRLLFGSMVGVIIYLFLNHITKEEAMTELIKLIRNL